MLTSGRAAGCKPVYSILINKLMFRSEQRSFVDAQSKIVEEVWP